MAKLLSTDYRKGLAYGLAGMLLLSPDGLMIRIVEVDQETYIAARSLFTALGMICMNLLFGSLRLPTGVQRRASIAYGLLFGIGSIMFFKSVQSTELTNTLVIISAGPLLAAIFAAVFIKERIYRHTWIACGLALAAAVLVFSTEPSAQFAGGSDGRWIAVGNVLLISISLVLIRRFSKVDIILGAAAGAGLVGLSFVPFADFANVTPLVWIQMFIGGFIIQGISFWLITRSARLLAPPQVSLLFQIELIFGPALLWLFVNEVPSIQTVMAGVIMVCVLVMNLYFSLKMERQARLDKVAS